jgi:hypothetical protein
MFDFEGRQGEASTRLFEVNECSSLMETDS